MRRRRRVEGTAIIRNCDLVIELLDFFNTAPLLSKIRYLNNIGFSELALSLFTQLPDKQQDNKTFEQLLSSVVYKNIDWQGDGALLLNNEKLLFEIISYYFDLRKKAKYSSSSSQSASYLSKAPGTQNGTLTLTGLELQILLDYMPNAAQCRQRIGGNTSSHQTTNARPHHKHKPSKKTNSHNETKPNWRAPSKRIGGNTSSHQTTNARSHHKHKPSKKTNSHNETKPNWRAKLGKLFKRKKKPVKAANTAAVQLTSTTPLDHYEFATNPTPSPTLPPPLTAVSTPTPLPPPLSTPPPRRVTFMLNKQTGSTSSVSSSSPPPPPITTPRRRTLQPVRLAFTQPRDEDKHLPTSNSTLHSLFTRPNPKTGTLKQTHTVRLHLSPRS